MSWLTRSCVYVYNSLPSLLVVPNISERMLKDVVAAADEGEFPRKSKDIVVGVNERVIECMLNGISKSYLPYQWPLAL